MSDPTPTPSETSATSEVSEASADATASAATATQEASDEFVSAVGPPSGIRDADDPIVLDDVGDALDEMYGSSMVEVEDGMMVTGSVVRIDRDEVLLDIGYKSEGVIPVNELSIRNDIDPSEVVSPGEQIEALVVQKEDKDGRLILSKKRAQYERAWGTIEEIKEGPGIATDPELGIEARGATA